jgi:hypothetical protein
MPSSPEKRVEQQRVRRARARESAAEAGQEADALPAAGAPPASEEQAVDPWPHEHPPRLQADFGGEQGRTAYELARDRWYAHFHVGPFIPDYGFELPPYLPSAGPAVRQMQIRARAALWDQAVRVYKDRQRDRSHRVRPAEDGARRRLARQMERQLDWVEDAVDLGNCIYDVFEAAHKSGAKASAVIRQRPPSVVPKDLPWPACRWYDDLDNLADLCVFMEAHPPTGEAAWCEAVEEEAARLYGLGDGDFWDRTSAPGYRLLLMLPDTPAELRDLPLDDRMWICKMNQPFMKGLTGDASDRLARMYQLAYTQYLGQRSHPLGIQSDNEYIATAGFDPMVPLDDELRRSIATKFQLSLYLPQEAPEPEPLRSLARPYTLIADVLHEISPAQRARLEWFADRGPARRQRKQVYCDYFGAGLIPFGDLYHFDAIGEVVKRTVKAIGCNRCGIDLNGILQETTELAPDLPRDFLHHVAQSVS